MKINRKKILIFVLLGFVIFLVAGYFLILDKQEQEDSIETTKNLFPFGDINPGKGSLFGGEQGTIGEGQDGQETKDTTSPEPTLELAPRLRQISFFPTGGFKSFTQTEDKEVSEVSFDEEGNSSQIIKTIEVVNQLVRYTDIENADIYESKVTSSEIVSDIIVSNFIPNAEFSYFNPLADTILF